MALTIAIQHLTSDIPLCITGMSRVVLHHCLQTVILHTGIELASVATTVRSANQVCLKRSPQQERFKRLKTFSSHHWWHSNVARLLLLAHPLTALEAHFFFQMMRNCTTTLEQTWVSVAGKSVWEHHASSQHCLVAQKSIERSNGRQRLRHRAIARSTQNQYEHHVSTCMRTLQVIAVPAVTQS